MQFKRVIELTTYPYNRLDDDTKDLCVSPEENFAPGKYINLNSGSGQDPNDTGEVSSEMGNWMVYEIIDSKLYSPVKVVDGVSIQVRMWVLVVQQWHDSSNLPYPWHETWCEIDGPMIAG